MGVLFVCVLVSGVAPVVLPRADSPVDRGVIECVAILVFYVLAVALVDLTGLLHLVTSLIPVLTLLYLDRVFLVLSLGLPVGGDFSGSLPSLQFTQVRVPS